jgi:hypothetical protein
LDKNRPRSPEHQIVNISGLRLAANKAMTISAKTSPKKEGPPIKNFRKPDPD